VPPRPACPSTRAALLVWWATAAGADFSSTPVISCRPIRYRPAESKPQGRLIAGRPAHVRRIVQQVARYNARRSSRGPPKRKAVVAPSAEAAHQHPHKAGRNAGESRCAPAALSCSRHPCTGRQGNRCRSGCGRCTSSPNLSVRAAGPSSQANTLPGLLGAVAVFDGRPVAAKLAEASDGAIT